MLDKYSFVILKCSIAHPYSILYIYYACLHLYVLIAFKAVTAFCNTVAILFVLYPSTWADQGCDGIKGA